MKHRLLLTLIATSFLLLGSFSARAGLIVVDGGELGSISSSEGNDIVFDIYGSSSRSGYYGSQLKVSNSGTFLFDVTYLGHEAGFDNSFVLDGSTIFNTADEDDGTLDPFDTAGPFLLDASTFTALLIPFLFNIDTDNDGDTEISVANGSNPNDKDGEAPQNFFVSCVDSATATSCDTIDIFLDDSGFSDDDNHDDIAIRLTARVPEPATLALLGLGLIGISLTRGRKAA